VEEGKKLLNSSIALECDRRFNGVRVKLILDPSLPFHSLFPGQIIAVEGTNPEGLALHATRILHVSPIGFSFAHFEILFLLEFHL
jgi:hypothetical protein